MGADNPIVQMVGPERFDWMARSFCRETTLQQIPDDILQSLSSLDITAREYFDHPDAVTAIALITFAYQMAGRPQQAHYGSADILLVKVLAKAEKDRRDGRKELRHEMWRVPLYELVTGPVGERIRASQLFNTHMSMAV